MLTTVQIDPDLLENARRSRTGEEAVNEAIREYVQRQKQLDALKYFGTFDFDPEYDYKKERKRR
ncbi:MAG: hypothetical protein BWK80_34630 [Desulfobacteraceae bacterium IS3]|nr:MAG: hypothetical protein BWK80_34630 [Desulfobacteraceae bacterium IS3]